MLTITLYPPSSYRGFIMCSHCCVPRLRVLSTVVSLPTLECRILHKPGFSLKSRQNQLLFRIFPLSSSLSPPLLPHAVWCVLSVRGWSFWGAGKREFFFSVLKYLTLIAGQKFG